MSPWTVLGWVIVIILCIQISIFLLAVLKWIWEDYIHPCIYRRIQHLKTRKIAPKEGQVWSQDISKLRITRITDEGRICIRVSNTSWSDSPKEWQQRMKRGKLYLIKG